MGTEETFKFKHSPSRRVAISRSLRATLQMVLAEAYLRAGRASDAVNLLEHLITAGAGTSVEHRNIKAHSKQWLSIASSQLDGMGFGGLAVQNSRPLLVFVKPKK